MSWHDSWLKIVFFAIYPFKLVKAILAGCKTIRSSTRIIHRRRAMLPRDLHINRKLYPYTYVSSSDNLARLTKQLHTLHNVSCNPVIPELLRLALRVQKSWDASRCSKSRNRFCRPEYSAWLDPIACTWITEWPWQNVVSSAKL